MKSSDSPSPRALKWSELLEPVPHNALTVFNALSHWVVSHGPWLYRGESRAFPDLKAKLGRKGSISYLGPLTDAPKQTELTEYVLTREFVREFPAIGEPHEVSMITSALGCWTLMQHYGTPTRLLDWTSSAWIACYFACVDDHSEDGYIWSFAPNTLADHEELVEGVPLINSLARMAPNESLKGLRGAPEIIASAPAVQHCQRSSAQASHFTVASKAAADHGEMIVERSTRRDRRVLRIRSAIKRDVLVLLYSMGIHAKSVLGGAPGLGQHLADRVKFGLGQFHFDDADLGFNWKDLLK